VSPRLLHYSDVENAYDDPERVGRLAGTLLARDGPDALTCGTGDDTAPGVLALRTEGEQSLDLFEAIDPDAETFGNHDFDFGTDRTLELVERSPQPWLTANVHPEAAPPGADPFGAGVGVRPWTVLEADGARVGLFGLTDPHTPDINPAADGLAFRDPVAAAEEAVAELRGRDVDYVVVLSHLGRGDEALAAAVDVDVVLGGHVHSERIERIDGTVLTRPGVNGEVVMEVSLPDGEVTRHAVADGPLHEPVAASLRERMAAEGLTEVVARAPEPVERTERTCFRGESRIGNFVADAYHWAALEVGFEEPVVGLQNSGGIREGPPLSGEVTLGDLMSVIPFPERVAVLDVPGRTLRSAFAEAARNVGFGESEWWHAHVSNARLEYDHGSSELLGASVGGRPVEAGRRYRVATSEYLLHTEGEFPSLTPEYRVGTLDVQYEVLAAYARAEGISPRVEGRVVRHGV
jgi:2',3'-cyclic-nucleotide 2'-phosphodiesterase (5'-nucleotidase family)